MNPRQGENVWMTLHGRSRPFTIQDDQLFYRPDRGYRNRIFGWKQNIDTVLVLIIARHFFSSEIKDLHSVGWILPLRERSTSSTLRNSSNFGIDSQHVQTRGTSSSFFFIQDYIYIKWRSKAPIFYRTWPIFSWNENSTTLWTIETSRRFTTKDARPIFGCRRLQIIRQPFFCFFGHVIGIYLAWNSDPYSNSHPSLFRMQQLVDNQPTTNRQRRNKTRKIVQVFMWR